MSSRREEMRRKRKREQKVKTVAWLVAGLGLLAVLGYTFWLGVRPAVGEEVQIMADVSHVADGTDPGPYNTDPPTSGRHYAQSKQAGFTEEPEVDITYPAGYLVHSLEHGYVIFWYNCQILNEEECSQLKTDIKAVINRAENHKIIGYPWPSLDVPVVATSWGRIHSFETFDVEIAYDFYKRNLNKAPEPHAD